MVISIILVPGVGTAPCDSWFTSLSPWIDFLAGLDNGVTSHCFDHHVPYDEQFTWQHLLDAGQNLLTALQALLEKLNVNKNK